MIRSFTVCLLLFSFSVYGQETQDGYQIIENNPDNVSYVSIGIDPIFHTLDAGNINDAFSERLLYAPLASIMLKNRIAADITYTRSFVKKEAYTASSSSGLFANPQNGIKHFSDLTIVGKYYFYKKLKPRKGEIKYKKTPPLSITENVCNMWGLRGGVSLVQKPVDGNDADIYGYDANDPAKTEIPFNTHYLTMANYTTVSLGLSFCTVHNMIINVASKGKKSWFSTEEFYIDVQRVIHTSFDDMVGEIPGNGTTRTIKVTDVSKNDWGFKIGQMSSGNNKLGARLGLEAGFNTVPVYLSDATGISDRFFFNIRLGIAVTKKLNPKP